MRTFLSSLSRLATPLELSSFTPFPPFQTYTPSCTTPTVRFLFNVLHRAPTFHPLSLLYASLSKLSKEWDRALAVLFNTIQFSPNVQTPLSLHEHIFLPHTQDKKWDRAGALSQTTTTTTSCMHVVSCITLTWANDHTQYSSTHTHAHTLLQQAKKWDRAIAILSKNSWWEKLVGVVRALEKSDARLLGLCAGHLRRAGQYAFAKETLLKLDDTKALITLYVEDQQWDDAFLLLHAHPGGCGGGGERAGG